jgi:hypothetical protein
MNLGRCPRWSVGCVSTPGFSGVAPGAFSVSLLRLRAVCVPLRGTPVAHRSSSWLSPRRSPSRAELHGGHPQVLRLRRVGPHLLQTLLRDRRGRPPLPPTAPPSPSATKLIEQVLPQHLPRSFRVRRLLGPPLLGPRIHPVGALQVDDQLGRGVPGGEEDSQRHASTKRMRLTGVNREHPTGTRVDERRLPTSGAPHPKAVCRAPKRSADEPLPVSVVIQTDPASEHPPREQGPPPDSPAQSEMRGTPDQCLGDPSWARKSEMSRR